MLTIRRLNMDSSWQLRWAGQSILIDPWLKGAEIDFIPAFNKQWHATPPVEIESLGDYDAILVSQHFSDHCHEQTLQELDCSRILTTPQGAKRILKIVPKEQIQLIPNIAANEWLPLGGLEIGLLPAPRKLSATFSAIVIRNKNQVLVYAPHGYSLTKAQQKALNTFQVKLLITSLSTFRLPFFLGGFVNPGIQKAKQLMQQLNPEFLIATHDENKHAVGLVKKIAMVNYPSTEELSDDFPNKFIDVNYTDKALEIQ